jgi:hypothetical protein
MEKRFLTRALLVAALFGCLAHEASAQKAAEYGSVVKLVESHYHVKHKGTPFIAKLAVKVVRPEGVRDFKLATFEDQDFSSGSDTEFAQAVRRLLVPVWSPVVQTRSRDAGEQTFVYLREAGENFRVMVVTIERRDGSVLEAEVSPQTLAKWMKEPDKIGRRMSDSAQGGEPE